MKKSIAAVLMIIVLVLAFVYVLNLDDGSVNDPSIEVATTIYPLFDITRSIAGDLIEIGLILPAGASPHTFEPTPSLIKDLSDVTVVYAIGHEFDDWVDTVINTLGTKKNVVDEGINILESSSEHSDDHNENLGDDHEEDHGEDPHYWLSVPNAMLISGNITADLSERFPEHADVFHANLQAYLLELEQTDEDIRTTLSEIENRELITLHDAWYYFAAEYDLEILGTFEPSAGREPTPQYLTDLIEAIETSGATTLYTEPQLDTSSIESFLTDYDLSLATLDPIGGASDRSTYIELMFYNAKTISDNQK